MAKKQETPVVVEAPKPVRQGGITKKQTVINMLQGKGTTVVAIADALKITKTAARSLIGDVRHSKIEVLQEAGVYRIAK